MSSGEKPSWDSLPDHLKTSQLAYAIDPEGAHAAADNLDERLFLGRAMFHGFSRAEMGAYLWRKFGQQSAAMSDADLLTWLQKMDFRGHAAFDGMEDNDVVRFLRQSAGVLDDSVVRYTHSADFPIVCRQAGVEPGSRVEKQIELARRFFCEDPVLSSFLPDLLEH